MDLVLAHGAAIVEQRRRDRDIAPLFGGAGREFAHDPHKAFHAGDFLAPVRMPLFADQPTRLILIRQFDAPLLDTFPECAAIELRTDQIAGPKRIESPSGESLDVLEVRTQDQPFPSGLRWSINHLPLLLRMS